MERRKGIITLTVFEMKNEMHVHIRLAPSTFSESVELLCACPIVRHEKLADRTQTVSLLTVVD